MILTFTVCKDLGPTSAALSGLKSNIEGSLDYLIRAPIQYTSRVQKYFMLIGHTICAVVKLEIFGHLDPDKNAA